MVAETLRAGGRVVAETLRAMHPGVTTSELDEVGAQAFPAPRRTPSTRS